MMSQKKESEGGSASQPPYHVIHKLPPGNTPYVRAKHVQVSFLFIHSLFSSLIY